MPTTMDREPQRSHQPLRRLALLLVAGSFGCVSLGLPGIPPATAQSVAAPAAAEATLSQPQLQQMLAPIALYPDALLAQVLMAATYPLELVQAQRWLAQGGNTELRGDALARALDSQPWDASVKSLVPFPDVLKLLNDQLEWTQSLGDALLAQQEDVFAAVQALRARAQATGSLQSSPQQTVTVSQNAGAAPIIIIEPAQPEQVFVPVYNPTVVYGAWPYAAYPPAYYPPPPALGVGNALLTGMAFATGVAVTSSLWGWARPGWGHGRVDLDVNRVNQINVNRAQISNNSWQHNVSHRHGVAYRDQAVNNRYRGASANQVQSRDAARGRLEEVTRGDGAARNRAAQGERVGGDRAGGNGPLGNRNPDGTSDHAVSRPGGGDRREAGIRAAGTDARPSPAQRRAGGDIPRPNVGNNGGAGLRQATHTASGRPALPQGRSSEASRQAGALRGVGGQGRETRAASQRGQASRQAQPAARAQARNAGGGRHGGGGGGHRGRN